jgi:hypothetical protein
MQALWPFSTTQPVSWTTPPSSEDVSAKVEMAPPVLVQAGGGVPCVEGSFVERCRVEAFRLAVHSSDPRRTPALRNPGAVRVGLVKTFRRAVGFGPEPVAKVAYVLQHYETGPWNFPLRRLAPLHSALPRCPYDGNLPSPFAPSLCVAHTGAAVRMKARPSTQSPAGRSRAPYARRGPPAESHSGRRVRALRFE